LRLAVAADLVDDGFSAWIGHHTPRRDAMRETIPYSTISLSDIAGKRATSKRRFTRSPSQAWQQPMLKSLPRNT